MRDWLVGDAIRRRLPVKMQFPAFSAGLQISVREWAGVSDWAGEREEAEIRISLPANCIVWGAIIRSLIMPGPGSGRTQLNLESRIYHPVLLASVCMSGR